MEDLLIYVAIAFAAFYIGWHFRGIVIITNLARNPERLIAILNEIKKINEEEEQGQTRPSGDLVEVEAELVNGLYYAYNKATGQFLGQGSNLNAVLLEASKRFPDKKFWCPTLEQNNRSA